MGKVSSNRGVKYVIGKMEPFLKDMRKLAPIETHKKMLDELKGATKLSLRNGTGGTPSINSGTFKDSFKGNRYLEKVAETKKFKRNLAIGAAGVAGLGGVGVAIHNHRNKHGK